jgi:cytochrome bd ubiquinol oxidase subunit II
MMPWGSGSPPRLAQDAAVPPQSLEFLFWGGGLVVFPVVLIYTGAAFWVLRGKVKGAPWYEI